MIEKASLIIVNYNSHQFLKTCLESLMDNTFCPFEILVVDNHSTKDSISFLRQLKDPRLKIILNQRNRGYAAACNQGIEAATGEIFVTMNPDIITPPGWLTRLIWHLKNNPQTLMVGPKGIGIGGRQSAGTICFSKKLTAADRKFSHLHRRQSEPVKFLIGCLIVFDRRLLKHIGYFDESLTLGADDFDLSLRIRKAGFQLRVAKDVLIRHYIHASFDLSSPEECQRLSSNSWEHFRKKWAYELRKYGWKRLFEDEQPVFPGEKPFA